MSPGQPELPDWVYNGAIIGVQGGTDRMLEVLDSAQGIEEGFIQRRRQRSSMLLGGFRICSIPCRAILKLCCTCKTASADSRKGIEYILSPKQQRRPLPFLLYKSFFYWAQGQDVRVAALWIQDWSGKITTTFGSRVFWNWRWNETWYPALDVLIKDLDERRGIKVPRNFASTRYFLENL